MPSEKHSGEPTGKPTKRANWKTLTPGSLSKSSDGEGLTQGGVIAVAILDSFSVLLCAALGSCWWLFYRKDIGSSG